MAVHSGGPLGIDMVRRGIAQRTKKGTLFESGHLAGLGDWGDNLDKTSGQSEMFIYNMS
jgi:hypothetical protein